MSFDPTRILELAKTLETGSADEKLALLAELDQSNPLTSGILMRALDDDFPAVRLAALQRLEEAGVRPPSPMLQRLFQDPDPDIRQLALSLQDQPDAKNPLEDLIPMIEGLAGSLGPFGGLLKSMVQTLRDVGEGDEATQLDVVRALAAGNPATFLAIHQALRSPHVSVRLAALEKVIELPDVTVPEEAIAGFLADPSDDLRAAAEAVVAAGRVGSFDDESFRNKAMQSMLGSLTGGMGIDFSKIGDMLGGLGGLGDLGGLAKGVDVNNVASMFGGGAPQTTPTPPPPRPQPSPQAPAAPSRPHQVAAATYVVCNLSQRDRLIRSMGKSCEPGSLIDVAELARSKGPQRWAIIPQKTKPASPGWPESLQAAGMATPEHVISGADVARRLSEQSWGAAWADHRGAVPVTIVFHDGILSRAAWGGERAGSYPTEVETCSALALLGAFLDDPTDDELSDASWNGEIRELE